MTHSPPDASDPSSPDPSERDSATDSSGGLLDTFLKLGATGWLGIAWLAAPALGGFYLLARIGDASEWLSQHGTTGIAIYAVFFMITAGLGLLPTYAQAVLGGWVFGLTVGIPAALAGFTGGALIGYGVARLFSRDRTEHLIQENPKARAVRDALIGSGFWRTLGIVTLVRIPPNSPFALTNLVMASSGVRLPIFIIGTAVGMAPRTIVTVAFAHAAATTGARDIQAFVQESKGGLILIVGIVIMLVVLGIIGHIANQAIARVVGPEAAGVQRDEDTGHDTSAP